MGDATLGFLLFMAKKRPKTCHSLANLLCNMPKVENMVHSNNLAQFQQHCTLGISNFRFHPQFAYKSYVESIFRTFRSKKMVFCQLGCLEICKDGHGIHTCNVTTQILFEPIPILVWWFLSVGWCWISRRVNRDDSHRFSLTCQPHTMTSLHPTPSNTLLCDNP